MHDRFGVVVIGRNEGERLRTCFESLCLSVGQRNDKQNGTHVVYVDSGSTDDSVQISEAMGASVVILDLSTPFTAARARNEGFARLRELDPHIEHVQFIDGVVSIGCSE